jgi:hypothetical protein
MFHSFSVLSKQMHFIFHIKLLPGWAEYYRFKRRNETPQVYKSYPCSLRVHLLHLISIMLFKLGHASIPRKRIFLPLFLSYDISVLQNFKIFTHLLPNFSYKDPRLPKMTYHCINFINV